MVFVMGLFAQLGVPQGGPLVLAREGWLELRYFTRESARVVLEVDNLSEESVGRIHSFKLRLSPGDHSYTIRIMRGDEEERLAGVVRTPDGSWPVSLGLWGDTRWDTHLDSTANQRVHRAVARALLELGPFDLVVHTGDIVLNGKMLDHWEWFFDYAQGVLSRYPNLFVPGNHENSFWPDSVGFPHYEAYIGQTNYALVYGKNLVGVVGLGEEFTRKEADSLLGVIHPCRWRILVIHRPLFSSGEHGSYYPWRDSLLMLIRANQVHFVISGHDHHYERTKPLAGTVYLVVGGGGAPLRPVHPNEWTEVATSTYSVAKLTLWPDSAVLRVVDTAGRTIDTFKYPWPAQRPSWGAIVGGLLALFLPGGIYAAARRE